MNKNKLIASVMAGAAAGTAYGNPGQADRMPNMVLIFIDDTGWELKENRFTPDLPAEVNAVEGSETVLELVPYGSTTLRLTVFPVAESIPE